MQSVKETLTGHAGLEELVQTTLQRIAIKAKREKKYRFRNLYKLLNEENLTEAWKKLNKNAASGIDKVTAKDFEENLTENIRGIVEGLKRKRYRAKMVRRVFIPKGNGKLRPLGIPAIKDKLVQIVVTEILKAIYEEDFLPCSYGYRTNTGALDAIRELSKELQFGEYNYVVEADIKGFFDNINHEWLVKMLEQRVDDRAFIKLIQKWLKAGIMEEDGKVIHPTTGTPQGGIVSPVLANIYLHYALDLWFEKVMKAKCGGSGYLCRYADDFVVAFGKEWQAKRFYNELGQRLKKFGLELSQEKTLVKRFSRYDKMGISAFEFLGFEFRWMRARNGKRIIKRRTSPNKFRKSVNNLTEWCKTIGSMKLNKIFSTINAKLRGYYNYYGIIGNSKSINNFFYLCIKILYKWLKRKSHKRRLSWEKFNHYISIYGLEKPRITQIKPSKTIFEFCLA
jgi:RNA-directed DNA polymerase